MDWLNIILVSVSMAVDCMTIGATDGIQEPNMKKRKIFFIAFIFGLFQGLMPVIGYFVGYYFKDKLEAYIPWIAFSLLTLLGLKNIFEWAKERIKAKKEKDNPETEKEETKKELSIPTILVQGIATSIDALSIGFVYLNYSVTNAMIVFSIIAVVTFSLSLLTIFLGKKIGGWLENWSGLIAGIVFIGIGLKILLESILSVPPTGNGTDSISYLFSIIQSLNR